VGGYAIHTPNGVAHTDYGNGTSASGGAAGQGIQGAYTMIQLGGGFNP
jgi:hypothetical protein